MPKPPQLTGDLYDCYVQFMKDSEKDIGLRVKGRKNRSFLKSAHKPISRARFSKTVKEMKPKQRREFEAMMRKPWKQTVKEGRKEAEQALRDWETKPKVRARVALEIERAVAKAGFSMDDLLD